MSKSVNSDSSFSTDPTPAASMAKPRTRCGTARNLPLVLKKILSFKPDSRGKWTPNYEGPYVVKRAFLSGALILTTMDGEEFTHPVSADAVKKYFA